MELIGNSYRYLKERNRSIDMCAYIPTFLCLDENLTSAGVMTGSTLTGQTGSSTLSSPSSATADADRFEGRTTEDRATRRVEGVDRVASDEMEIDLCELVAAREGESEARGELADREDDARRRVRKDAIRTNE